MQVDTDRRYTFAVAPEDLWATVTQVDRYQEWWPWLRRFDGTELVQDARWRCTVQPPLPYAVRFAVCLDQVDAPMAARATVSGDVVGHAHITIGPAAAGSEVHVRATLSPANGFLRVVSRVAGPVVRFGHDWVLDSAVRQFTSRAL
ncbi:MAG TPA: SRPBCC family protein [Acidimicrobiales bacterium]|nr:SRPBCC family protein [Acidimicrobiales bacterium]